MYCFRDVCQKSLLCSTCKSPLSSKVDLHYQEYACENSCGKRNGWKMYYFHLCFTCFSQAFRMHFTPIFHMCVEFRIVKHGWKCCEVMSTLSHKFWPAFHTWLYILIQIDLKYNFMCYFTEDFTWISHASSRWLAMEFHMLLHKNFTCKLSVNGERILTATSHTWPVWCFTAIHIFLLSDMCDMGLSTLIKISPYFFHKV